MKVQVLSSTLDNQTKIVYDCLISGVSSAVERYPSKLDVVGSIPILRSEPFGSYSHRPSKRTGLTVNQRLVGAVPTMGVLTSKIL